MIHDNSPLPSFQNLFPLFNLFSVETIRGFPRVTNRMFILLRGSLKRSFHQVCMCAFGMVDKTIRSPVDDHLHSYLLTPYSWYIISFYLLISILLRLLRSVPVPFFPLLPSFLIIDIDSIQYTRPRTDTYIHSHTHTTND